MKSVTISKPNVAANNDVGTRRLARRKVKIDIWYVLGIGLTLLVLLPIFAVLYKAFTIDAQTLADWQRSGIIWEYAWRTVVLILGVGALSACIGVPMAWLVSYCQFPGKKVLEFCALLPFLMPSWIAAWSWKDMMDYSGIWHQFLKKLPLDNPNAYLIHIDNIYGAIFILAFTLYPYVYLMCRTSFKRQSPSLIDSARSLGKSGGTIFLRISVPLIRPALAASVLIVMMEVLNDYGTVRFFSVPVLALGIEDAWVNRSSPGGAAILSALALIIAFCLIFAEQLSRNKANAYAQNTNKNTVVSYHFVGGKGLVAAGLFTLPIVIGFVAPFLLMLAAAIRRLDNEYDWATIAKACVSSVSLASIAALLAIAFATLLIWTAKNSKNASIYVWTRLASLGYAIPGLVLSVGILIPAAFIDKLLPSNIILVGSTALLVYAWVVRFLAIANGNMDAGFSRIRPSIVESGHALGLNRWGVLFKIYLPLMRGFAITAGIMVFIDSLKELPIAMLIRPFNMELLSIYVWQYGSLEQIEEAAPGALILIAIGVIPILFLWRKISKQDAL